MALQVGYTLSSEEFGPRDLLRYARQAEETGFDFAVVSDHYHPWVNAQGQSPFVWSVLGGISQVTDHIPIGTGVTCPTMRIQPAIIAQAAATAACMLPGRFFLGVGSGEYLNEHVLGDNWPPARVRLDMLEEAISVIRELWEGRMRTHIGDFYTVDQARLYTLPDEPPPIMVAAAGSASARLASRAGDGLFAIVPNADLVREFQSDGDGQRPRYGQLTICWDETEEEAVRMAKRQWPNAALPGPLMSELKVPGLFEAASKFLPDEAVAKTIVCGPDPERHQAALQEFSEAGFDHVFVHQVGPKQEGFFRFYEQEVLPKVR